MSDRERLLFAIRETPEDDAPRLVYADWLEDNGDEAQARLIRIQCEAARLDEYGPACQQSEEEAIELRLHYLRWKEHLPELKGIDWGGASLFRRGFLDDIGATFAAFLRHSELIRQLLPLRRLRLTNGVNARDLPKATQLTGISELAVFGNVPEKSAAALANCPHIAGLKSLSLSFHMLGLPTAHAVANSPFLSDLRELRFGYNGRTMRAAGLALLAESPYLNTLERLDLHQVGGGRVGMEHLANWSQFARLTWLDLSENDLDSAAFEALAATPFRSSLRYLRLSHNPLTAADLRLLGRARLLPADDLDLSGCPVGTAAAEALACVEDFRPQRLELSDCQLTDSGVAALTSSGLLSRVWCLDLDRNNLTNAAVQRLADCPFLTGLRRLYLSRNNLDREAARLLARSPSLDSLQELYLGDPTVETTNWQKRRAQFR